MKWIVFEKKNAFEKAACNWKHIFWIEKSYCDYAEKIQLS